MNGRQIEDWSELAAWAVIYAALGGWSLLLCWGFWPFK
jgi:hypothetical protein